MPLKTHSPLDLLKLHCSYHLSRWCFLASFLYFLLTSFASSLSLHPIMRNTCRFGILSCAVTSLLGNTLYLFSSCCDITLFIGVPVSLLFLLVLGSSTYGFSLLQSSSSFKSPQFNCIPYFAIFFHALALHLPYTILQISSRITFFN